jgi:uncharacterized protein YbcV (DUF1398 family)
MTMNAGTIEVVEECTRLSDEGGTPFPAIVARLAASGIEQYHADLLRAEKTYYMPDGTSHVSRCDPVDGEFARDFSGEGVSAAVRGAQSGDLSYPDFCTRIAAAGCTGYFVSLAGRRAVYYGRTGENVVELFPGT